MTRFKTIALIGALITLTVSASILGADRLSVPVNPDLGNQILTAARAAEQEGNFAGALREYRRCLELYPNEPLLQAPIYLAMGAAANKAGDQAQAKEFTQTAQALDPNVSSHVEKAAPETVTRGGKADTAIAIFAGVMGAVQQARAARAQQMQNAPQANYAQPPGGNYGYPAAPVGDPGYAAPPNGYAPMPGYGQPAPTQPSPYDNAGASPYGGQPASGYPQAQPYGQPSGYGQPAPGQPSPYGNPSAPPPGGQPNSGYPQAQPYGQPSGYGQPAPGQPSPYGNPGAPPSGGQPNSGYPQAQPYGQPSGYGQPAPGQPSPYGNPGAPPSGGQPNSGYPQAQPYGQPAPGQYPPQGQNPYGGYAPPPGPYGAPSGYSNGHRRTRGEAAPEPLKVIHDHSQLGDKSYFEKGCGALITVIGGNLTFTPSGGESPLVIPASEIREIRLNSTVGREIGAFHIATKKGLFLNLAPATGTRDDGRVDVETLRKQLGLAD
jgi:hypothetical protein